MCSQCYQADNGQNYHSPINKFWSTPWSKGQLFVIGTGSNTSNIFLLKLFLSRVRTFVSWEHTAAAAGQMFAFPPHFRPGPWYCSDSVTPVPLHVYEHVLSVCLVFILLHTKALLNSQTWLVRRLINCRLRDETWSKTMLCTQHEKEMKIGEGNEEEVK